MLSAPSLPLPVRIYNSVRRSAARVGLPLPSLEAEALIDRARRKTGLSDLGPDTFREPLDRLLRSLQQDAGLHALGRSIAAEQIVSNLENRLRLFDCLAREPGIRSGRVERPIVIVGMARTGTSILHELIGQDPTVRVPEAWEVMTPVPPPQAATYASDPRIAACDASLAQTERLIPDFRRMHRMAARLPQEDVAITSLEFTSMLFEASFRLPSYTQWFHGDSVDLAPAYALHRSFLQLLQWRCPANRWVLKTPGHLWALESLLAEYPDACLVQTHRDPLQVLSSLTSLCTTLRALASDEIVPHEIAREWHELNAQAYDACIDARESGLVRPEQVIDIPFAELMSDPFAKIRQIYEKFDVEYTPDADRRMREYLATHTTEEHGKHAHRFEDTGLDLDEARASVQRYQDYFDVPSEITR
jgi:hypothetical protein